VSVGDDFVQYLTELGIGTPGINLVASGESRTGRPRSPSSRPAVRLRIMTYGPGEVIDRPSVQILVRNPAYLLARDKADQIRDAFDGLANWPINGTRYLSVTAMSDPAYLTWESRHEPGGRRHEFKPELRQRCASGRHPVIGLCGRRTMTLSRMARTIDWQRIRSSTT